MITARPVAEIISQDLHHYFSGAAYTASLPNFITNFQRTYILLVTTWKLEGAP